MAQIVWSDPALDQLDAIADYIALDKPEAARELVQRVFEKTDRVRTFTQLGRRVPELKNSNFRQVWINPGSTETRSTLCISGAQNVRSSRMNWGAHELHRDC